MLFKKMLIYPFIFISFNLHAQMFRNPISTFPCADPAVFNDQGSTNQFFLACTGGRFFLRKSSDLVNWYGFNKKIINSSNGLASWARTNPNWRTPNRSWAPHLTKIGNRYVAYYTQNAAGGYGAIGASATTDILKLNFQESVKVPLARNDNSGGVIDPSYFKDPSNGKHYLLYKVDGNSRGFNTKIVIRELGPLGIGYKTASPSTIRELKKGGNTLATLVEGQELIKRGNYYYLFYSHGSYIDSYKVKVARSTNIYGPYTGDRIILRARSKGRFYGTGHGTITTVNNKQFYLYHAYDKSREKKNGKKRYAMLDRIYWQDGWPLINNGYPSIGSVYQPKSRDSRFHNVLIKVQTINIRSPKFSLDVIDRKGRRTNACLNAGKIGTSKRIRFDGRCLNGTKIDLHTASKFRICAGENGRFGNGAARCSAFKNFSAAEQFVRISK